VNDDESPLKVTDRQLELLRTLRRFSIENTRMPSIRELAELLRRSPSTIHQHLTALERRGYVERDGAAHGLRLLVEDDQLGPGVRGSLLPMKGTLYPGRRIQRSRTPYPKVSIGADSEAGDYAVRIQGDRLAGDGIYDGDLLIIRPGPSGEFPALVEFPDGSCDVRRTTSLRDGSFALLPPRPRLETRRRARRAQNVLVRGRVMMIVRVFD